MTEQVRPRPMRHRVHLPTEGDQLELALAGPGLAWREPWGGRSPRGLTKQAQVIRLEPLPAGALPGDAFCCQGSTCSNCSLQLELPL